MMLLLTVISRETTGFLNKLGLHKGAVMARIPLLNVRTTTALKVPLVKRFGESDTYLRRIFFVEV